MKAIAVIIIIASWMMFSEGCMYPPEKFTEKRLVLARGQTVAIHEINLSVTNNGCGRNWMKKEGGERPYCELSVKTKDSIWYFGDSFAPLYVNNNIKLVIDKMNPWGREEDSIPPGGCRIIVTKLDDLSR